MTDIMQSEDTPVRTVATPKDRELWMVQGLADGKTVQILARELKHSYNYTAFAVRRLIDIYDLSTQPQLVAHFLRNGWID